MKIYLAKNRETLTGDELKKTIKRLKKIDPKLGLYGLDDGLDYMLQFATKITIYKVPTKQDILDRMFHKSERNDPEIKEEAQEIFEALKIDKSPFVIIEYKKNQNNPTEDQHLKERMDSFYGVDDGSGGSSPIGISVSFADVNSQNNLKTIYQFEDYRYHSDIDYFGKKVMKDELIDVVDGFDEY